ncbi:MAG: BamA/TamA family outer membrane protein [Chitinophagaceae bacterium]
MLSGKPTTHINLLKVILTGFVLAFFASCTIVKKYQPGKPFVYKTNINLIGNFSKAEKQGLITGLEGQLDDSMRARKLDKLLWSTMKQPPVYDSINADNSIVFMRALLSSLGYFNDSIYYTSSIKFEKPDQYKTTVDFFVRPGKQVKLDSITYNLRHTDLQFLTDSTKPQAIIKKGDPFAKSPISAEFDRLTELYRNTGYFRFSRDELVGIWDTLDVALLQPTLDPFEQLELLQKLQERRNNPTANLEIRLKSVDSTKLVKYYIGNVTVYPDFTTDTVGLKPSIVEVGGKDGKKGIKVVQHYGRFKPKIFPPNIYLPSDSVYRFRRYLRTINRLNSLGTWRAVSIDQLPRKGQDTIDFVIRLTPAKKYLFDTNLEGSINQNAFSGNILGIGVNVGLQNKNFAKAANIANSNLRFGIELGNASSLGQFIQTQQIGFSHSIYMPRAIPNFGFIPENLKDNFKTVLNFKAANTERRWLYNLTTLNGSWGYEFQRRKMLISVKLPNIEYSSLIRRDSLDTLIKYNPSLRNVFTDGFISSVIGSFTLSGGSTNRLNVLRVNVEESGLLTGMIRNSFLDKQLYRFLKLDAEFAYLMRFPKSALAFRFFAGAGYEFNSTRDTAKRHNLPFFKEYFAGGPNSMRAWSLRRLGPGSSIKEFNGVGSTPDRYGDIQLEGNIEYRFPLGTPFGVKVNGAVFTDIGNVWYMKSAPNRPSEEVFKINRLWKDLAVGSGVGLRVDFNFLVIRFDYAYKVKDPSPAPADAAIQNKWFGYKFSKGDQFQLGIGYPFIF